MVSRAARRAGGGEIHPGEAITTSEPRLGSESNRRTDSSLVPSVGWLSILVNVRCGGPNVGK